MTYKIVNLPDLSSPCRKCTEKDLFCGITSWQERCPLIAAFRQRTKGEDSGHGAIDHTSDTTYAACA